MQASVNWGILGNAWIARDFIIPAMERAPNCRFYAIASRRELSPKYLPDVKHYIGYEDLLDDPGVDAVYIPLPNSMHCEWSIKAMRKGKHVLCEKPIALNEQQCNDMIREAGANNVILMEAFMYRYSLVIKRVLSLLNSGVLGKITGIHACHGYDLNWVSPVRQEMFLGGGCLYDVGCYCVDFMNMIMKNQGEKCIVASAVFKYKGGIDEHMSGCLQYSNGTVCSMDSWFDGAESGEIHLFGEKGVLHIPTSFNGESSILRLYSSAGCKIYRISESDVYTSELEAFADAMISNNKECLISLKDSLENMRAMDYLFASRE
jgi:predicted dehydrogenase